MNTKELTEVVEQLQAQVGTNLELIVAMKAEIHELSAEVAELKSAPQSRRNYGPPSQGKMSNEQAWRIMYGDMTGVPVKDIASRFGLSRGQVYSVRGGYTFNHVKAEDFTLEAIKEAEAAEASDEDRLLRG